MIPAQAQSKVGKGRWQPWLWQNLPNAGQSVKKDPCSDCFSPRYDVQLSDSGFPLRLSSGCPCADAAKISLPSLFHLLRQVVPYDLGYDVVLQWHRREFVPFSFFDKEEVSSPARQVIHVENASMC